jgi:Ca-activated chloride channel homolog
MNALGGSGITSESGALVFSDLRLLWVLLPLYLVWLALWIFLPRWRARRGTGQESAVRYSSLADLRRLKPTATLRLRTLVQLLRWVSVGLLVLAMARPQTGRKLTEVSTQGVDIVLAVDTSRSMEALDLDADRPIQQRRNRLEVVKAVVEDFVKKRENDQIGLVVFGSEAYTQCPLTLDHGIVATFLDRLETGMAGDATALGDGLGVAIKRLKESKAKSKVIVLLTDGRNNAGRIAPTQGADIAKLENVKVYTIGAGTRGQAPFIQQTIFGAQVVYQDVEIDEATLGEIARRTGGKTFRAEDTQGLADVYDQIDRLEKTEISTKSYMEYNEQFRWFVLPALALLLAEVVLLGTRFRKLP